jgi:hypothetical protein
MTDNVTNIFDAPISSPLTLILQRRHHIRVRQVEIKAKQEALTKEYNELYHEDRALGQAEDTVRKLLERK